MYKNKIKRTIDFVFALIAFVLFLPVFVISFLFLSINNKGSAFFFQSRPGKDSKLFKVIKFKTMNDKKDSSGKFLPDEERLTKVGEVIRKTSIDELPQLLNVIKGDMSLIGPRPLLVEYLPLYNEEQSKRHLVRPGITGWAQVNGRNAIDWKEKFELDVWYINNCSFWLDIKIIFLTIIKVFKSDGVSSATSKTMEKFRGN